MVAENNTSKFNKIFMNSVLFAILQGMMIRKCENGGEHYKVGALDVQTFFFVLLPYIVQHFAARLP